MKTASFSQCRKLTVWSNRKGGSIAGRCWDLDYVAKHDEWRLLKAPAANGLTLKPFNELSELTSAR